MSRLPRLTLVSLRELLVSVGPFLLLSVTLLVLAYQWLDPAPPRRVTLATGPAQSAYDAFGQRYRQALAAHGIDVVLVPSEGSQANLQMLRAGKVDLAFVQGGSGDTTDHASGASSASGAPADDGISSLGSLFVEPVWLFYRESAARRVVPGGTLTALTQLQGLRLNTGTAGSGVPSLMAKLFEANGVDTSRLTLSQLEQTPATVAFLEGRLDAIVFVSAPESLMVQMLLQTPGVRLMDFVQSEAYARRFSFLTPVLLPRGVVNLALDQPPHDVRLVASTTSLLAHESAHPALLQLFAQTARQLHGGAGWFNRVNTFPNIEHTEYPLAREAERTIRNGTPLLQRWLPFWLANLVERMWLVLGILIAVLLPLSRVVPPLYEFRIRSRVFRWYAQLREIEERIGSASAQADALDRELDTLDAKVGRVVVPLSYADELYTLRNHIRMVRDRLHGATPSADDAAPPANMQPLQPPNPPKALT